MVYDLNKKMKILDKCVCCNNQNLKQILDLKEQPLANSYLRNKNEFEDNYPLSLNFCPNCSHLQLSHAVNPDLLFKNYLYVSGTSKTLLEYFDYFVTFVENYIGATKNANILDIACNDGSQLNSFKKRGYNTFGIDPAKNLYEINSKEHSVICDYLSEENVKSFGEEFDAIIAQNVFAHNDYPEQFLLSCKQVLKENGYMFIQTSQANMIENNEFDTIYHEHISFFTPKSFCTLAKRCGFNVVDIQRTKVHGTSFVFILSKTKEDQSENLLSFERELTLEKLEKYSKNCEKIVENLNVCIDNFRNKGYKIIGYGAAAKGNTLLNFGKISLDYIVDDNKLKENLYTPGMKIPIYYRNKLIEEKENKFVLIPLAWNFFDEIKTNVNDLGLSPIFIKYFPEILVIE